MIHHRDRNEAAQKMDLHYADADSSGPSPAALRQLRMLQLGGEPSSTAAASASTAAPTLKRAREHEEEAGGAAAGHHEVKKEAAAMDMMDMDDANAEQLGGGHVDTQKRRKQK